jgi:hypothetical protein
MKIKLKVLMKQNMPKFMISLFKNYFSIKDFILIEIISINLNIYIFKKNIRKMDIVFN